MFTSVKLIYLYKPDIVSVYLDNKLSYINLFLCKKYFAKLFCIYVYISYINLNKSIQTASAAAVVGECAGAGRRTFQGWGKNLSPILIIW